MRVVLADNYDRESVSEVFVTEVLDEHEANEQCKILNGRIGISGDGYYKVVDDDYKLYKFEP